MNTKHKHAQVTSQRNKAPLSLETMNQMVALYNSEQWALLETAARDATKRHPEHFFGWKALGKTLLKSGKPVEAIEALLRVTKITPSDPDPLNDLAITYHNLGRLEESEACYRRLLKINQDSPVLHDTLGVVLCDLAKFSEAEVEFRRALTLNPRFVQSLINLGYASSTLGRWDEVEVCYRKVLEIDPDFSEAHRRLGDLLSRIRSRSSEAIYHLERAIALNPAEVGSIVTLGNVLMTEKRLEESRAMFRKAQQIQPIITWKSRKTPADFSVLLLDAPGAGSTPVTYLVGRSNFECHFVGIMPDLEHDVEFLKTKANVVINMIADADNGKEALPLALKLADRLDRPIVNHPRKIMGTDRESIAKCLSGIPLCKVPRTKRFPASALIGAEGLKAIEGFSAPLLIRCAGTHGGDDFEKIDDLAAIDTFVSNHPDATIYLSEFADYRSADGYYRKYRLIFLNDQILPYHLAIHDHWMVHHFRTDMANQEWMRKEEEAFLREPEQIFNAAHYEALRQAAAAIGLEYCGIDCSIDQQGNIVVFEANATMLVHDEINNPFSYKNPYIGKIKEAFTAMLEKMVVK